MKPKIQDLIDSCNNCILSCEAALKTCKTCTQSCNKSCSMVSGENCSVDCQKIIDVCKECMHECNRALENKLYDTPKQEAALKNCINACKDGAKRCEATIAKILDKDASLGCSWAEDSLNKCISACDECIESFEG